MTEIRDRQLEGSCLRQTYANDVDFAVLYGSRARGRARKHSDYDLLIGLRDDSPVRLLDRLLEFSNPDFPLVEAIPLTPGELEDLWYRYGRTLLDAAVEGIPVHGAAAWAPWRARVEKAMREGILERQGTMWIWHRDREPEDSGRLQYGTRPRFPA